MYESFDSFIIDITNEPIYDTSGTYRLNNISSSDVRMLISFSKEIPAMSKLITLFSKTHSRVSYYDHADHTFDIFIKPIVEYCSLHDVRMILTEISGNAQCYDRRCFYKDFSFIYDYIQKCKFSIDYSSYNYYHKIRSMLSLPSVEDAEEVIFEENASFKPNPEIYEAAKPGNFLQFKQIPNIKIRFHRSIHDSLYAKPLHKDQVIDFDETSEYLTLHLPECSEEVVLPWVLSQMGKAEILEPRILREKICDVVSSIRALH